ncbi:lipoyl(octanoyl) transferase LipB [Micrococcales bacterium 31B]|nr:lipoyl(octanoyl) transferase LipB [Micrococcales bacterium 31B]
MFDFRHLAFMPTPIEYTQAWALQRETHEKVAAGEADNTIYLLEHEPVYTAGKRTNSFERPVDGAPVVDVDRGGRITWHGPGQLVGYPIVKLAQPIDVVNYVRCLEAAIIDVCVELGLDPLRVEGRSGVWFAATPEKLERKVCAIGVRVAKGVTMHGFAFNCNNDIEWSKNIVACGIEDAGVTTLSLELGREVTVAEVLPRVEAALERRLAPITVSALEAAAG